MEYFAKYGCSESEPVTISLEIVEPQLEEGSEELFDEEGEDDDEQGQQPTNSVDINSFMRKHYILSTSGTNSRTEAEVIKFKATMKGELICTFANNMYTPDIFKATRGRSAQAS